MNLLLVSIITLILPVLLSVAMFTLAERTVMASMQRRFGPSVSGLGGVLQPFWDALKLGVKEPLLPELSAAGAFAAAPMISFVLSQVAWCGVCITDSAFQGLVLMAISSLSVYGVMLAGWASNSKYAFLGCLRSVALMVSYELSLGVVLLSIALFTIDGTGAKCLSFGEMPDTPNYAMVPLCLIFLICILAETKRVPFDLPEAEAELVAGYNVEYSSLSFALFFISEYANMAVMSAIASAYFLGGFSALKITALFFAFVWTRGTLPRYRYDQFMRLGWKALLPLSLAFFSFHAAISIGMFSVDFSLLSVVEHVLGIDLVTADLPVSTQIAARNSQVDAFGNIRILDMREMVQNIIKSPALQNPEIARFIAELKAAR